MIERATLREIQFFLALANAEGWNPGLLDAVPFYFTDPNGFFIAKQDGKMIGCISAVAYDDSYGFLGIYIVLPEFRGKGYGIKLWNHAMDYLGNRTIGLDGVVGQQENYKKSGFKFYYNNIRFGGKVKGKLSNELEPMDRIPFQRLVQYDTEVYGLDRSKFLERWVTMANSKGFAKIQEGVLHGYGMIRQCESGYKIGPIFANNFQIANEIFLALVDMRDGADIFLDVPEPNKDALNLAKEYNLNKVFETARMYNADPPNQRLSKVFGITTFELG